MALDTPFPVGVHLGCLHTGRLRGDKDGCLFAEDAVGLLAGLSGSGLQDTRILSKHPAPPPDPRGPSKMEGLAFACPAWLHVGDPSGITTAGGRWWWSLAGACVRAPWLQRRVTAV